MVKLQSPIPGVPEDKDLCVRAARLLQQESGISSGVDIFLEKRIPMGGGLGGGSSDAATTLLALNRLWGLGWKRNRLMELGLKLGADVPVFIFGDNAFAEGIGEKLSAIVLPPAWYLVLTPPVQVPTVQVFGSKELTRNTIPIKIPPFSVEHGHNDLEPVVCRLYPEVARYLEWLKQLDSPRMAAMTGSGACVFAEFATELGSKGGIGAAPVRYERFRGARVGSSSLAMILWNSNTGESPSGKAPDFDSGIRRFDPYLPSQFLVLKSRSLVDRMVVHYMCLSRAILRFPV